MRMLVAGRPFLLGLSVILLSCSKQKISQSDPPPAPPPPPANPVAWPPATWREHWFEHNQLVKKVYHNANIAVYYDDDVNRAVTWPFQFIDSIWTYTKQVYGQFGPTDSVNLLFTVLHTNKYGGGHPFTYFDAGHDYRNGIDIGLGANAWVNQTDQETDIIIHEIAHIVEGASKNVKESPAFEIWGDSKWAEIFIYDVYDYMNRTTKRSNAHALFSGQTETFPRAGTAWYRHWFFPIYQQHEGAKVLNRFFELLATHFPQRNINKGKEYTRRMNMGEFIHFWSGAAGVDLSHRALLTFGTKDRNGQDWLPQLAQAKSAYGAISYEGVDSHFGIDRSADAQMSVSTENLNGSNGAEGSAKLIDMDLQTKYFSNGYTASSWIQQTLPNPVVVNSYMLSSANDVTDRDPKSWELLGSNDELNWTLLDQRSNQVFYYRHDLKQYETNNTQAYKYYRLKITANGGSPDIQLGEWRLYEK